MANSLHAICNCHTLQDVKIAKYPNSFKKSVFIKVRQILVLLFSSSFPCSNIFIVMSTISIMNFLGCHLQIFTADYCRFLLVNLTLYNTEQMNSWWTIWLIQIFVKTFSTDCIKIFFSSDIATCTRTGHLVLLMHLKVLLFDCRNTLEHLLNIIFLGKWKICVFVMS